MRIEDFIEGSEKPRKFDGRVEVMIIDNGILVAHYEPTGRRNSIKFFKSAEDMTEYMRSVVALYQREIEAPPGGN